AVRGALEEAQLVHVSLGRLEELVGPGPLQLRLPAGRKQLLQAVIELCARHTPHRINAPRRPSRVWVQTFEILEQGRELLPVLTLKGSAPRKRTGEARPTSDDPLRPQGDLLPPTPRMQEAVPLRGAPPPLRPRAAALLAPRPLVLGLRAVLAARL